MSHFLLDTISYFFGIFQIYDKLYQTYQINQDINKNIKCQLHNPCPVNEFKFSLKFNTTRIQRAQSSTLKSLCLYAKGKVLGHNSY